mmetsp:Transcript_42798/g.48629  ORF Transcript_42798/g.48629 Transcript_42798/m.48629 type:complete len:128 (-) Transcript_42798:96-479(-)
MLSTSQLLICAIIVFHSVEAFVGISAIRRTNNKPSFLITPPRYYLDIQSNLSSQNDDNNSIEDDSSEVTTVGSSEYYKGFVSRPMNEEPLERVSGDNLLMPILKFAGAFVIPLVLLTAAFLASNGII